MGKILYFRADGNKEIGTGHIMRCLSIASAARDLGVDCAFIAADTEMQAIEESRGHEFICLDSIWNSLESELDPLSGIIAERNIKNLVVDSYYVTEKYLACLCELTEVTYIDDLNAFHYPCHTLINYNIYADSLAYSARYPSTRLFLGPKYVPLRAEFQHPAPASRGPVHSVVVTTGGSDSLHFLGSLVRKIQDESLFFHIEFHLVLGRFNHDYISLAQATQGDNRFCLHQNVTDMGNLMRNSNLAISAGGSTLYELCACGIPTISFCLADNQMQIVHAFDEKGLIPYAGDIRVSLSNVLDAIVIHLQRLIADEDWRYDSSLLLQKEVSSNGAYNLANALVDE